MATGCELSHSGDQSAAPRSSEQVAQLVKLSGVPARHVSARVSGCEICDDRQSRVLIDLRALRGALIKRDTIGAAIITGPPAAGKTFLASARARELIASGISAQMSAATRLIRALAESRSFTVEEREQALIYRAAGYELLIIEEVGRDRGEAIGVLGLAEIIDARHERRTPTISVSNLPVHEARSIAIALESRTVEIDKEPTKTLHTITRFQEMKITDDVPITHRLIFSPAAMNGR